MNLTYWALQGNIDNNTIMACLEDFLMQQHYGLNRPKSGATVFDTLSNPFFSFQEVFEEYKIESTPVFMFFRDGLKVCTVPAMSLGEIFDPSVSVFISNSLAKLFGHFLSKTHLHITKYQSWHNRICIEARSCATFACQIQEKCIN